MAINILKNIKKIKFKKEYFSAFSDTFLIIVFTVLPSILGIFTILFNSANNTHDTYALYKSGEFLLYSVSFLGSAYIVFNQYNITNSKLNGFSKLTIAFAIIFSISYASLTNIVPDPATLKIVSFSSLFISILIFYISQVISNKNGPDIPGKRRDEQEVIENALT